MHDHDCRPVHIPIIGAECEPNALQRQLGAIWGYVDANCTDNAGPDMPWDGFCPAADGRDLDDCADTEA